MLNAVVLCDCSGGAALGWLRVLVRRALPDRRSPSLNMDRFAQAFAIQKPQAVTVQIRKRGEVFCGVPVDFFEPKEGATMFKVATQCGEFWGTAANIRQCSGVDGGCACAGEAGTCGADGAGGRAQASTAAAAALQVVPLGNTGITTLGGGYGV